MNRPQFVSSFTCWRISRLFLVFDCYNSNFCEHLYTDCIFSSILGTYRPGVFLFQYPTIFPFSTVHGVLKTRILKWFAIPFSSGPHSVGAKVNTVLPREHTGHSKHPLPTTQEKTLHMDITRWSILKSDWLYSLQPKTEKLYTVSKNKTGRWLWLRSWTPYCQIQTQIEEIFHFFYG